MQFITVNVNNEEHLTKISEFCKEINNHNVYDFINNMQNDKIGENDIKEILMATVNGKVNNICMINGTKDNKLVELKIENLKDSRYEKNKEFIEYVTAYSFDRLGALTVAVFSSKENDLLKTIGYESIGNFNNYIAYVKDKELEKVVGGKKI